MLNERPQVRQMKAASESLNDCRAKIPAPAPVQRRANRTGLPDRLKAGVESLSGLAMDDVRVHFDSAKPAQLEALAYTQGSEIHVGPGQERHLPHEAWHVVQQKQGRVRPTIQTKGVTINDDAALEREADLLGGQAAAKSAELPRGPQEAAPGPPDESRELGGAQPVQRTILMAGKSYPSQVEAYESKAGGKAEGAGAGSSSSAPAEKPKQTMKEMIDEIMKGMIAEGCEDLGSIGGTLATMIANKKVTHPLGSGFFKSYKELFEYISKSRVEGGKSKDAGDEREKFAARIINGWLARDKETGKDKRVFLKDKNGGNTNIYVDLDVENDGAYMIVGGGSKGNDLPNFKRLCQNLKAIAAQDGKVPMVFCDDNTPDEVLVAAQAIVGGGNVIEVKPAIDSGFVSID
ncbi:MAG: hypothetical protein QOG13_2970 [Sphingomonadales bacterium]|jgi:hypothetical protein|nr:hypothetical protein [Sphingomonadales bacterium]